MTNFPYFWDFLMLIFSLYFAASVATLSLCANLFLYRRLSQLKSKPQDVKPSYEAEQLMHDLTSPGVALVKIQRISSGDVLIRSPRT